MPSTDDYDFKRARILLNDLEKSIRGKAPTLKLEPPTDSDRVIRGVANRTGLLRLGIELASMALKADSIVAVQDDGTVHGDGQGGVLEVVLVDDSPEKQQPQHGDVSYLGRIIRIIITAVILVLMTIGLITVLSWLNVGG